MRLGVHSLNRGVLGEVKYTFKYTYKFTAIYDKVGIYKLRGLR